MAKLYAQGCPSCEKNCKFVQAIIKQDCSAAAYKKALEEYQLASIHTCKRFRKG